MLGLRARHDVLEVARRDRIHADVVRRPLEGHRPHQLVDAAFRRGVRNEPLNADGTIPPFAECLPDAA